MKPKDRTQERTQKAGAYAALGVAGAFVLIVAYFVVFGGGRPSSSGTGQVPQPIGSPAVPLGQDTGSGQVLGSVTGVRFDLTDKKDPNKRTGLVVFDAMDPLEGHRWAVTRPQAWRYLDGGRTLYIRADSGEVYRPGDQKEPESGTIRGRVEIKMFEVGFDAQKSDPATTPALLTITTESLSFESAIGELETSDRFAVVWAGGVFEGDGLSLVFNQPLERLERGEVHRNGRLALRNTDRPTRETESSQSTTVAAASPGSTASTPAAAPPAAAPLETIYRLVGSGSVVASQSSRRLTSDTFQVLARLIDNTLPDNAIRPVRFIRDETRANPVKGDSSVPSPTASGLAAADAPKTETTLAASPAPSAEPLVMTWSGPCIIVPLPEAPAELAKDHLAARFAANADSKVTLEDKEAEISGHASAIDYGATSGTLSLIGTESGTVALAAATAGRIETTRIDADLVTGIIRTPGKGTLTAATDKPDQPDAGPKLSWLERGEFAFETTDQGLSGRLKEATVQGGVRGEGRGMSFSSATASAAFTPTVQGRPEISRVDLAGDAVATSADTGSMSGQKIHVEFDPPTATGGNPRARFVRAEDGFKVERQGQRLSGQYLESRLIDVAEGKVDVGSVLARGGVAFASEKDFISGTTEELNADLGFDETGARKQLVLLVGEGTTLSRNEPGREQGTISGTQLSIDGLLGRLESFGPGTFAYRGLTGADDATIDATWQRRMVFEDSAGSIDCWGDSKVRYSADTSTRSKVDADRVKLFITPGAPGQSIVSSRITGTEPTTPASGRERSILAAEAYGSILDRENGLNARIESRSYAAGTLQKLSYIEGPSILASNVNGTIDVPGAGKFLLVDQTQGNRNPAAAPGVRDLGGDTRGTSLFEWATSLHAAKQPGTTGETIMTMKDGVSVVHRALNDGQVTEIKCTDLVANLIDKGGSLGETGRGLELQSVTAIGGVYAASGPPRTEQQPRPPIRELIAHKVEYDAIARRIEARALPGGVVSMFEPAAASPTTASWLTWDIEKNSVQVRQPAGVAPR